MDDSDTFEADAVANIAKRLRTDSNPRPCISEDSSSLPNISGLGDLDRLDADGLTEFDNGCQRHVFSSTGDLDLDRLDANVNGCQSSVFDFDGDLDLDRLDAV